MTTTTRGSNAQRSRTRPCLDVSAASDLLTSDAPPSLPLQDNDTYKGTVKQQIKDWLSFVSQRKHQEWLIVLVVKPDPTTGAAKGAGGGTAASRLFRVGGSVLDRIRSDFNVGKRDRWVELEFRVWSMRKRSDLVVAMTAADVCSSLVQPSRLPTIQFCGRTSSAR